MPDLAPLPVPKGLSRCPICNEYRGVIDPSWINRLEDDDPSLQVVVACWCDGIPCGTCGKNRIRRPTSSTWDERGGLGHVPYFAVNIPCAECHAKKKAKEDEEQRARKAQPAVQDRDDDDPSSEENREAFRRHMTPRPSNR